MGNQIPFIHVWRDQHRHISLSKFQSVYQLFIHAWDVSLHTSKLVLFTVVRIIQYFPKIIQDILIYL